MAKQITSVKEALEVIGPVRAMAIAGVTAPSALRNWQSREKRFPPDTYVAYTAILRRRGYTAPPGLWGMKPA